MLIVFGSINIDVSINVKWLPLPGETVLGDGALITPGGKGANQAHAARMFGVATAMVGAVGDDDFSHIALAGLKSAGVDLTGVHHMPGLTTGLASIAVAGDGENTISVASGANKAAQTEWLTPKHLSDCRMLVLQMEVPIEASVKAAKMARDAGCKVVMNAAPMIGAEAIEPCTVDWLVVNQDELHQLADAQRLDVATTALRATRVARHLQTNVVVTLGGEGAIVMLSSGMALQCDALEGTIVDTSGAGDTFTGVFAAALVEGHGVERALRYAVVASGLCCRAAGAQTSQPSRLDIDGALKLCPAIRTICRVGQLNN